LTPPRTRTPLALGALAALLYFSEGLPYGVVKDLIPVYLRLHHVELKSIGLLNVAGFAWVLKFLWSPAVDAAGTYRRWIAGAVAVIALALAAIPLSPVGPIVYGLVCILALASATQDIAVDAFTIQATPERMLGPVNSIRVTAYRAAMIVAGGGVLALAGWAGWKAAFFAAASVALVVFVVVQFVRDDRDERTVREGDEAVARDRIDFVAAFRRWAQRPRAGTLLAIVFLYRLGELAIVSIVRVYWVDRGYSPAEIGTITSVIGVSVSVIGAIAGGALVARLGLWRSLLLLGIAQTASNLGYALVATFGAGRWAIYAAAIVENFGYGLGTAAFLAFLMSLCDRERAATEYALLTAAFNATGTLMSAASGYIAQGFGYAAYFWLTVFLGVPALLLLPRVRREISS
jgi:PAT family beta-lactamase induction signal transducer AmpG